MDGLPDIGGLQQVEAKTWRALRRRLISIGLDQTAIAPVLSLCTRFAEDERDPIRLWHLRLRPDPAALAMRLLMFGDVITPAQASAVLGGRLVGRLVAAGLLRVAGDAVHCVLRLAMAENYYVFADELRLGGDVVMGMRETTEPLWRAIAAEGIVSRVLDLGCGAGAIALLMSQHARKIVATDINPRAVVLARINMVLNGVHNVEVRQGDLFAPVAGETFDLIAAHPPYVALPDGEPIVSHLHGGVRGDELACRLLAGLEPHLSPGGRAVLLVHWPLNTGEQQTGRIRAAADPALDLIELRLGTADADDLATFWGLHLQGGAPLIARVRDHYARLDIVRTVATLCVLRRGSGRGWTRMLDIAPEALTSVTASRIDLLLRSGDLLHGDDAGLAASRLRLPPGTMVATTHDPAGASRSVLLVPAETLLRTTDTAAEWWRLLVAVDRAQSVGQSGQALSLVRAALGQGLLEPA